MKPLVPRSGVFLAQGVLAMRAAPASRQWEFLQMRTGDNLCKRYTAATPMQLGTPVHCQDDFAICRGFELLQAAGWQERAKVEAFLAGRRVVVR